MITESIQLKGCVDAKYANFFLSLLEKHEHSSLLTDEIVQDFCIGGYDYPDEFSVTGIPAGWIDSQNKNEVFHQLKDIETTLSHYLRKTWHNDAIYPMDIDTNFSSVFNLLDRVVGRNKIFNCLHKAAGSSRSTLTSASNSASSSLQDWVINRIASETRSL